MSRSDPAHDRRADYDYSGGAESPPPALRELAELAAGAVRFDSYSRALYATDASIFEVTPLGVVFPRDSADVARVLEHCWEHEIPVLPRGAGTSLAGQAVNAAVVLDFTQDMDEVLDIEPVAGECTVQPGIVLGELNAVLAEHDLKFAPDPAWADKSTIGGAIGNNSSGAHSLAYGLTADHIHRCEVLLADGSTVELGPTSLEEVALRADPEGSLAGRLHAFVDRLITEERDLVRGAFPALERNVAGYNLDDLVDAVVEGSETVNLARLFAGSEGTLGIVTAVTLNLEPVPPTAGVALLGYTDRQSALREVPTVLDLDPDAVELIDEVLLELASESDRYGHIVDELSAEVGAVLLVEWYATDEDAARGRVESAIEALVSPDETAAVDGLSALSADERDRFWALRKSGLPILLSRTSDEKHIAFIEDTAVPPGNLAEYVAEVESILAEHDATASFYGHAGPGCLHIRPLVDTKSEAGQTAIESIASAVCSAVRRHGGTMAGEHGDGRARTQFIEEQYGPMVLDLFRDLKSAVDPNGILNPGQICGDVGLTDHHRFGPEYEYNPPFTPALHWENENGMQGMVELCHGCGGCRGKQETTGGIMCPTYRAAEEEITSTRGRANLLRQAMNGNLPRETLFSEDFHEEVLDLCIGCKGCTRDCPSAVDLAKLKAEVTHATQQRDGIDRRTSLFSQLHRIGALGSAMTPLSNWMLDRSLTNRLGEWLFGIARERQLPRFASTSFLGATANRSTTVDPDSAVAEALVVPDALVNYHEPSIGHATVSVLESAGVSVETPSTFAPLGRAAYSVGRLDLARDRASSTVTRLWEAVNAGRAIVVPEPSAAVMLQDEYGALIDGPAQRALAEATYTPSEFLESIDATLPTPVDSLSVIYHGHCHQQAMGAAEAVPSLFSRLGLSVDLLDSGCCGMAGSFGYKAEQYSMSVAIGHILAEQLEEADGTRVIAPGASCRTQVEHLTDLEVAHPMEVLAESIEAG